MFIACSLCVDVVLYGLHAISHLLLTTNLCKKMSHCFSFTDGTTEAQRSAVSCSGSHIVSGRAGVRIQKILCSESGYSNLSNALTSLFSSVFVKGKGRGKSEGV